VELYRHVAEDKGVTISASAPPDLRLTADHNRLRQVLANLLDNAIKYTPRGGGGNLSALSQARQAVITVADSCGGIPQEEMSRIWERLYRVDKSRSQRGLGLGLSLVKAVVRAHQGSVEVSSEPGVGSSFTLLLPTVSAPTR